MVHTFVVVLALFGCSSGMKHKSLNGIVLRAYESTFARETFIAETDV